MRRIGLMNFKEYKRLKYTLLIPIAIFSIILIIAAHVLGITFIIKTIKASGILSIFLFVVVSLLLAIVLTYRWRLIIKSHGHKVPFMRVFVYRLMGFSVSYLLPAMHVGGEPLRGYLLKKENIPLSKAFSSVFIDKIIEMTVMIGMFFLAAIIVVLTVSLNIVTRIILFFGSLMLFILVIYLIKSFIGEKKILWKLYEKLKLNKIRFLRKHENGIKEMEKHIERFYKNEKSCFKKSISLSVLSWLLMFLEYKFALLILGINATFAEIFLVVTGVGIAYSVPIPAAFGILELGQVSVAKVLNLPHITGLALSFLIRARDLLWTFIGFILLNAEDMNIIRLTKESKRKEKEWEKGMMKMIKKKEKKKKKLINNEE